MRSPASPSRPTGVSGRALAALVALAAALAAAFVFAPGPLAAIRSGGMFVDKRHLIEALREAFVEYWHSGDRELPPALDRVVDYWFRYHVAKAVIAATVLIVLTVLGVLLWKAFLGAGGLGTGRRAALASAGVLATILALSSLAAVIANVQGAAAPFASLLPMLTDGATDGELADTLAQVRQRLADVQSAGGRTPPALEVMISDFSRYHLAMAVVAAILSVFFIGISVVLWKRAVATGSSDRRAKRLLRSFAAVPVLVSVILMVVVVANMTTVADPVPALLAFFDGGW